MKTGRPLKKTNKEATLLLLEYLHEKEIDTDKCIKILYGKRLNRTERAKYGVHNTFYGLKYSIANYLDKYLKPPFKEKNVLKKNDSKKNRIHQLNTKKLISSIIQKETRIYESYFNDILIIINEAPEILFPKKIYSKYIKKLNWITPEIFIKLAFMLYCISHYDQAKKNRAEDGSKLWERPYFNINHLLVVMSKEISQTDCDLIRELYDELIKSDLEFGYTIGNKHLSISSYIELILGLDLDSHKLKIKIKKEQLIDALRYSGNFENINDIASKTGYELKDNLSKLINYGCSFEISKDNLEDIYSQIENIRKFLFEN